MAQWDEGAAKITSTRLGYEDHGILTAMLMLEGEEWGQGFGGYGLDGPYDKGQKRRLPSIECGRWVAGILDALEVESWEQLPGQIVRYRRDSAEFNAKIVAIGHAYKNRWFTP